MQNVGRLLLCKKREVSLDVVLESEVKVNWRGESAVGGTVEKKKFTATTNGSSEWEMMGW